MMLYKMPGVPYDTIIIFNKIYIEFKREITHQAVAELDINLYNSITFDNFTILANSHNLIDIAMEMVLFHCYTC